MAHVADYKKEIVNDFVKLLNSYPIIGAVNMENMPAPQLQKMREQLRGTVVMRMAKRKMIVRAIEKVKEKKGNIGEIEKYLGGMPALIFTNENPFKIYKEVQKNKSSAPAKAGQIAPKDIIINKGPTPFAPGPIIGELGAIGIKTGVENGKVVVKENSIVVKEGDKISQKAAEVLTRLGIQPMEIGLNIVAVYENGIIFTKNVLSVDEKEYIANITKLSRWSFNLAMNIAYLTKDTTTLLIAKAFNDAKAVAVERNILNDETVKYLLAKADMQANALKNSANIDAH